MSSSAPLAALRAIVGADHLLVAPDQRAAHEVDWTGQWRGTAMAVVRPADADEVAAVVATCTAAGIAMTPQGGNTGLVGGGVPADGAVLVSLARLATIGLVDHTSAQLTVGAGTTLADAQRAARREGFEVGIDLGAREAATVGGMVATCAGGIHALAHGTMRRRTAGLAAVLADGTTIVDLKGLTKDASGYDLTGLLIGSEGTLGLVTDVRLQLVPRHPFRTTCLVGLASRAAAVELMTAARTDVPGLEAADWYERDAVEAVLGSRPVPDPLPDHEVLVLLEASAPDDPTSRLGQVVAAHAPDNATAVATDEAGRVRLWAIRETLPEVVASGPENATTRKLDVAVPIGRLVEVLDGLEAAVAAVAPQAQVICFGHLGDGNIHVQVLHPGDHGAEVDVAVLEVVVDAGGTISAEHGIGRSKASHLHRVRTAGEMAAMRAIKTALDPDGLMNPGVLLPADTTTAPER